MSNKKWECEIIAPPELHKPIQELFDAISWKLKHAESSSAQIATDINVGCTIYRQDAIDAVDEGLTGLFVEHRDIAEKMIGKLPSAQPTFTEAEIQRMQELDSAQIQKAYDIGFEEGKKEQKKGEWIKVDPHIVICPFCKHASPPKNFCADCGADMRGDRE